eukprot:8278063-Lingulodinium_polyedra.AAC.1
MAVRYDGGGKRHRDYTDAVDCLSTTAFPDWPVAGPRTVQWVLQEMRRWQLPPSQRHHWWRTTLRLTAEDYGVAEHECLCRAMEEAVTYDQLNASELASFEVLGRRLQLLEERYATKLLESEYGGDADGRHFETALFLGAERSHGRALISPELEEWIATRLKDEAA